MNTGYSFRPEEAIKMKTLFVLAFLVGFLLLPVAYAQTAGAAGSPKATPSAAAPTGCTKCAAPAASVDKVPDAVTKPIPGTSETMVVGRIENVIPIGILAVLGCEKCSAEAVNWALQQGSSFDDVERTLRTVAAMQKLDCFKAQFGPDVISRLEKPLAAAKEALDQARTRAAK
jgi:hypothetical protein